MEVQYFGWSGVAIRRADTLVGFDLFGDAVTWAKLDDPATTILCVTHGHPEHCGSLMRFLATPDAHLPTTHLISSPPVIAYVTRGSGLPIAHAHALEAGDTVSIDGARVTAFAWKHMPLLPPGVRPKIEYAAHVLSRPIDFARIAFGGLHLPLRAPMLGFHLTFADGTTVLNYAEGLHRITDPREVEAVAHELPADVLLFAVEPEDVQAIPRWLEMLRPAAVFLYEAHRPWRERFRLPSVDLNAYATELSERFQHTRFKTLIYAGQVAVYPVGSPT